MAQHDSAPETLSKLIRANVQGFKKLFLSLTGRESEFSASVSEFEFMRLCSHIVERYSTRAAVNEIYHNVLLLERCVQ